VTHVDLLRAILENPDDDRARTVYADALQEQGDPRGEFIALSLATGKDAAARAKELLDAHRQKTWQNFGAKGARYTWHRGFIHEVGADARALAGAGPLMFEVEPIQSLTLYGSTAGQLPKILGFPLRIRRLSVEVTSEIDARVLAEATTLGHITTLSLSSFGDRVAKILASSTAMPKLATFSAGLGSLTDDGLGALARGPFLSSVTKLFLGQHHLGVDGVTALASAPWATNLVELHLSENPIGDAGVAALASSNLASLRKLSIANNWRQQDQPTLGDAAADALVAAATTTFAKLESLDLSWNMAIDAVERLRAAYGTRLLMRIERFD